MKKFEPWELNDEHYVLQDFKIKPLFKGKYIFDKPNEFKQFYKEHSAGIKTYTEYCLTYDFKQLIKGVTRASCITSTLIGHILTNTQEYILQSGIIDTAVSDNCMVYCTRKISKGNYNKHNPAGTRHCNNTILVVLWSRRRIMLSQRSHNLVSPTSLLQP